MQCNAGDRRIDTRRPDRRPLSERWLGIVSTRLCSTSCCRSRRPDGMRSTRCRPRCRGYKCGPMDHPSVSRELRSTLEDREKTQELPDGLEDESGRSTTFPIATATNIGQVFDVEIEYDLLLNFHTIHDKHLDPGAGATM
ncbi:hypothetical protein KCU62_g35, partial [Aureobasidium sp. EXF-3399]